MEGRRQLQEQRQQQEVPVRRGVGVHQYHTRNRKERTKAVSFLAGSCLLTALVSSMLIVCAVRLLAMAAASKNLQSGSLIEELTLVSLLSHRSPQPTSKNSTNLSNNRDRLFDMPANSSHQLHSPNGQLPRRPKSKIDHLFLPLRLNSSRTKIKPYHSFDVFQKGMKEMSRKFKVFVYPHSQDEPYSKVFLPVDHEPSGNYASESYFKKALNSSHFVTQNPSEADLFFLPFSISALRHDPRVGVEGIQDFVREYVQRISAEYPFWNRSNGADHFYVTCHSVGRTAMEKAVEVKVNAIQVVCSSSYYIRGYISHKDIPMPQIWPRQETLPEAHSITQRKNVAFFAGEGNSPVREKLVKTWANDSDILVHSSRISTPYSESLLTSNYCLHVKGYEVNTARIGDAMFYGCVPVIIANYYDLPFNSVLNWEQFSVLILSSDIPQLKKILNSIPHKEYVQMQKLVMKVRKHFQWHSPPLEYDAFYMVMHELWLRRHVVRYPLH
ncbi:hypothetical protein O6H91_09G046900 [Diphasiastrum complanatum]|uniref:Uncharacterized protein n=1 Tax=Diphasiastrum complanatum TaxID=34168 RepID=A0ACC2CNR2_DIPCM|nr:hypothetical protein O6H91_09G046900 [Diphasiastrum complanatum]